MANDSPLPLLTADDVRQWRQEYDVLTRQIDQLEEQRGVIKHKLDAASLFIPQPMLRELLGNFKEAGEIVTPVRELRSRSETSVGDLILELLAPEMGGRTLIWMRERFLDDPEVAPRMRRGGSALSNAASRLTADGHLIRPRKGLYYLPATYQRIERGEIEEERQEDASGATFNSLMHEVMRGVGKPFTAAEANEFARSSPDLAARLEEQPSRVYSWLSRELGRGNLEREGSHYSYPFKRDGVPNGHAAGTPSAGEVAPSPHDDRDSFHSLLG